jgi:hypothetical protein
MALGGHGSVLLKIRGLVMVAGRPSIGRALLGMRT